MLQERRILMDIFGKFAETVVDFVRKYVVKFVVNKVLDWIWKKIKPKLLKVGREMKQKLKDKLHKIRKKWMNFKQRKRARAVTQTLIFMNEYCYGIHSCTILIMIIDTQKQMIIITEISLK
mgnify:CR=1 FL=1